MDSLHDLGFDTERISVEQYSALLTEITEQLAAVQKQSGAKLLWVKTTPVPTVPMYGPGCNDTRTWCAAAAILSAASLSPWAPSWLVLETPERSGSRRRPLVASGSRG